MEFENLMDKIMDRAKELLREKINDGKEDPYAPLPYLVRLNNRGEFTTEEIIEQTPGLLFASVDTTSHVVLWALLNLALNPEAQERLAKEIRSNTKNGEFTIDTKLPYLEACLRESHRLTPPNSVSSRFRKLENPIILGGYEIPPKTSLSLMQLIQRDPRYVSDADKFIPERWFPEAVAKRRGTPEEIIDHVILSAPFGSGVRMCLGARVAGREISSLICRVTSDWSYSLSPIDQKYNIKFESLAMANPFPSIHFEPRSKHL